MHLVFLWAWMISIAIGMFQMGYCSAMFSSFLDILHTQLGEAGRAVIGDSENFNSVMTTAIPLGAVFGSLTGGCLVSYGRRKAIIWINVVLCFGTALSMIFNFFTILIGRIIVGFCVGVLTVVCPMFLSETSLVKLAGPIGGLNQVMVTVGIMVGYFFGFLAPLKLDLENNPNPTVKTTNSWRFVFMIPAFVAIIQSLLLIIVFTDDTPKYYRLIGKERHARRIELLTNPDFNERDLILTKEVRSQEQKVSICKNFDPYHRKAFIIGCVLAVFQQLTGINVVILYSAKYIEFGQENETHDVLVLARMGTTIIGVINCISAIAAIFLLAKFGRKPLMIISNIGMCFCLIALAVWPKSQNSSYLIAFAIVFIIFFEIGMGSAIFMYATEIMTEFGISIALSITWILTTLVSLLTFKTLGYFNQRDLYFIFLGINLLGLLFLIFFIKETKGESKESLKYLYSKVPYEEILTAKLNATESTSPFI
ncbi:unnamed protein product [Moneuplotes crassus]|uniref:Hexose transporter 1 n=1 Tax=Euplotes crassus TaxID=5936 RepID=A0AAD1UET7_EUPCR|nr:unnamed protein product [Moneuplotes crassus]